MRRQDKDTFSSKASKACASCRWKAAPHFHGLLCKGPVSTGTGTYPNISPHRRAKHFKEDTCFSPMSVLYFWTQFIISVSTLQFL